MLRKYIGGAIPHHSHRWRSEVCCLRLLCSVRW